MSLYGHVVDLPTLDITPGSPSAESPVFAIGTEDGAEPSDIGFHLTAIASISDGAGTFAVLGYVAWLRDDGEDGARLALQGEWNANIVDAASVVGLNDMPGRFVLRVTGTASGGGTIPTASVRWALYSTHPVRCTPVA